ncbi:hypothetical protein LL946_07785 [Knoellia locipacati]|uniref:hypothetical protein n=1 Tax=Knoellia locipacati TaxID=882824 RepID=UPI00384FEA74
MPEFLEPNRVDLSLSDGIPTITLAGVEVSAGDGWSVLNRATLLVVDGPGDEGFLIRRLEGNGTDLTPAGWDDAVSDRGYVTVVAGRTRIVAPVVS